MGLEMVYKRRTFSGAGRPRSPGPREPSGRLQRPSKEETEAEIKALVLAQPHRQGDTRQGRRWAIGRLILDGKVSVRDVSPEALERAAESYAYAYSQLRWIMDSKRPWLKPSGPLPPEPTLEDRERVEKAWGDVNSALRGAGVPAHRAAEYVILDDPSDERVLASWIILSLPDALLALVRHYGLVD